MPEQQCYICDKVTPLHLHVCGACAEKLKHARTLDKARIIYLLKRQLTPGGGQVLKMLGPKDEDVLLVGETNGEEEGK